MFVKSFLAMESGTLLWDLPTQNMCQKLCKISLDTGIDTDLFKLFGIFKGNKTVQELRIIFNN